MLATVSFFADTEAQTKRKKSKKKSAVTAPVNPAARSRVKSIASVTKSCKVYQGHLTFYQDTLKGNAYISLNEEQLSQPMIYFTYSENGTFNLGLFRGNYRETSIIKFEKVFDKIHVKKVKTGLYFNPESALSKSSNANISDALVSSERIVAQSKGKYLIDATKLLGTELLHQLARNIPRGFPFPYRTGRLNTSKTFVKNLRSYPKNSDIVFSYTFDNGGSYRNDGTIADPRYITVEVQHSFVAMPDSNYQPRFDDPRVGYFTERSTDMTTVETINYRDMIRRWRLEKKNPEAAISEPIKPIVWWIENTTPKEIIPIIKTAGETWNLAFEPLGFKNAVVIKVQPDSATWEAGDIRYNVLRWASSINPRFGGYGPCFSNPLTGEILGADIMLEWLFLTNRVSSSAIFEPNAVNKSNLPDDPLHQGCIAGNHMHAQNLFGKAALTAQGKSLKMNDDGTLKITPLLEQGIFYLILHEMGHTFGLNHNMKASQLHPPADLHNTNLTSKVGLLGSVMDYPAINFAPVGVKQGHYYTTRPGPYDLWAINYGYSIGLKDPKAEKQRLNSILSQSHQHQLTFGNDADDMRSPGKGIDPRVMIGDLSSDAIGFARQRMDLCQNLIDNALNNYLDSGANYAELRKSVSVIVGQYAIQAGVVSRYIGGVYVDRSYHQQGGESLPYTPVPLNTQKEAMELLSNKVFNAEPIQFSDSLLAFMQPQRRGFDFFVRTEDPKMANAILSMQKSVLAHLLSSSVLNRMINSELYGNQYTVTAMLNDLTDAIFKGDIKGSSSIYRQSLQIDYVNNLVRISGLSESSKTRTVMSSRQLGIAKARAYAQLSDLRKQLFLYRNSGDEGSKQHKAYLIQMIDNALK